MVMSLGLVNLLNWSRPDVSVCVVELVQCMWSLCIQGPSPQECRHGSVHVNVCKFHYTIICLRAVHGIQWNPS